MTRIPATVQYGENEFEITIFDLSSGGARLSTLPGIRTGERISLAVADQKFDAEIRWLGEKCFGVRFDEKIDRFQLMRVQGVGLLK